MDKTHRNTLFYYTPAIGWGILICYFSLMPGNELPGILLKTKDVILHFGIYLGLTLLFLLGKNRFTLRPVSNMFLWLVAIAVLFMGVCIEYLQEHFIEGRHFEWADIIFNTLGALAVLVINRLLK